MKKRYRQKIQKMLFQLNDFALQLKTLENELAEDEEQCRLVAEFAYDWEYWQDIDGKYIYVSPSCTNITGYSPEEFFADKDILKKIIFPEDWQNWKTHTHTKLSEGEVEPMEFRIVKKDGELRWIHHVCRTVYSKDGDNRGIRGSNRDITDTKTMQEELKVLKGFLSICASCKMIKDKNGNWTQIEEYIREHSEAEFSHGICPECAQKMYPEIYQRIQDKKQRDSE